MICNESPKAKCAAISYSLAVRLSSSVFKCWYNGEYEQCALPEQSQAIG